MTDEQIIMATDICRTGECNGCPYYGLHTAGCVTELIKDAFGFINRQKAENKELRFDKTIAERHEKDARELFVDCAKQLKRANIEIKRLKSLLIKKCKDTVPIDTNQIKLQAIIEFAERLKERYEKHILCSTNILNNEIDNLVKEMEENK